jgi:hypothetical protein
MRGYGKDIGHIIHDKVSSRRRGQDNVQQTEATQLRSGGAMSLQLALLANRGPEQK